MNDIIPFNYKQHEVRTVMIEGEPWFVAKDVAQILGYKNTNHAVIVHCKRAVPIKGRVSLPLHPQTKIIPEADVYRLITQSELESAKYFEEWIMEEVLPTIRKTGGIYMTSEKAEELLNDPDLIIGLAQQVKTLHAERDAALQRAEHAERTKAHISDKKTASAMGTASVAVRRAKKAEREAEKLRRKDEIRQGFKKFYSKITSVCPHCQCKIYPSNAVWGEFFGPRAWGDVVHERCFDEYLSERASATDAFDKAIAGM